MSPLVCLLCLATFCVWGGDAQERTENLNNVDTMEPIARVSPDPANRGDYFGWAAIFHPTEALNSAGETMDEALRKIRVIVGAPYGTFPGGLQGLDDYGMTRLERVGLVYNCPVSGGTCLGVTGDITLYANNETLFDNAGLRLPDDTQVLPDEYAEGRLFDQAPNAEAFATNPDLAGAPNRDFEDKDGQILGAFLYSSRDGENFIACAPRWQLEFSPQDRNLARGICYASGRDLQGFTVQQPCSRDGPELDNNRGDSFCTAGHSATINDGYYVIGVPGIENNRGALAGRRIVDASSAPYTIGNFASRNNDGTVIPDSDPVTPQTDQYQGFRVINAWISNARGTPNESPDLVTTVPRASFDYTGRLHVYRADDLSQLIFTHCTGSQMGEFFGYSIAAADLNGDGFDEVIVGAPMYTNYTSGRVEIGRVYIFSSSGGELCPNPNHNATILVGPRTSPGARFGMSVASVGDVDRDGYQDVIIGAPYLDNGDNSGAVFVYYGRANIEDIPNQVPLQITASTVARNSNFPSATLTTFGFSLSSGYDVDANGYNDVVIGAYRSQSVFVLRTLPVADVTITFVPRDTVDIDSQENFNLEVTASFDGLGVADEITVSFQIREVIRGGSPRVRFNQGLTESDFGTGQFDFTGIGKNTNVTAMVTVLTQSDITNLDPLEFAITLVPIPRTANPGSLTDLSPFPVLRAGGESTTQVTIVNFCRDNGCEADVFFASVTELIPVIANDPNPITAGITVSNKAGEEPALGLEIELTDLPAYVVSASIDTIACTSQGNDTTRRTCAFPQRRINAEQSFSASIMFGLDTSMLIGNEANSTVNLLLVIPDDNQNRDRDTSDNTASIILNPTAEADLRIERMAFSPSNPNYTRSAPSEDLLLSDGINALMTEVTLEIAITNEGPSTIQNGTLNVWLPVQDSTSSLYYLYPYQIRAGPNVVCNETGVDPERLVDQSNSGRRKRSLSERRALRRIAREAAAADFMPETSRRAKRQAQAPVIDCSSESMRDACLMLECSFSNLERDTISISFNTRLDERFYTTLQTEAERAMVFDLTAYATVELDNDYITGDNTTNNMDIAPVIIRPVAPEVQQDFLHVILWPVLAGIIILILLIIILYFCGFFRRKKPGEGETEGDIDIEMPPGEGPAKAAYSPEKAEMEAENTVL